MNPFEEIRLTANSQKALARARAEVDEIAKQEREAYWQSLHPYVISADEELQALLDNFVSTLQKAGVAAEDLWEYANAAPKAIRRNRRRVELPYYRNHLNRFVRQVLDESEFPIAGYPLDRFENLMPLVTTGGLLVSCDSLEIHEWYAVHGRRTGGSGSIMVATQKAQTDQIFSPASTLTRDIYEHTPGGGRHEPSSRKVGEEQLTMSDILFEAARRLL